MTTIHAHARTKPIEVDLYGAVFHFKPNDKGHVVADIGEKRVVDRLLAIPEGFCVYGAAPHVRAEEEEEFIETSPYVLTQEGADGEEETIDLRTLDLAALETFCAENEIPLPEHKPRAKAPAKEQATRDAIVSFLRVE